VRRATADVAQQLVVVSAATTTPPRPIHGTVREATRRMDESPSCEQQEPSGDTRGGLRLRPGRSTPTDPCSEGDTCHDHDERRHEARESHGPDRGEIGLRGLGEPVQRLLFADRGACCQGPERRPRKGPEGRVCNELSQRARVPSAALRQRLADRRREGLRGSSLHMPGRRYGNPTDTAR
jgi:hypothetical protein